MTSFSGLLESWLNVWLKNSEYKWPFIIIFNQISFETVHRSQEWRELRQIKNPSTLWPEKTLTSLPALWAKINMLGMECLAYPTLSTRR